MKKTKLKSCSFIITIIFIIVLMISCMWDTAYAEEVQWKAVGSEGFSSDRAEFTSLYVDNGTPYVAYRDGGSSDKATVVKYDGSNWVTVGTPGFSAGPVVDTSLYVDDGIPYVAYSDGGNSDKATVKKYDGSNWVTVGTAGFSEDSAFGTSLYVCERIPYVAYSDRGSSDKATVKKYDGSNWVTVGTQGFSDGRADYISLDIDNGVPYIAYKELVNSKTGWVISIIAMKYDDVTSKWQNVGVTGVADGNHSDVSLYVDNGIPYVAYQETGSTYKTIVKKYKNSSWETVDSDGFSPGDADPSVFIDNGTPYVAYKDFDWANGFKAAVKKYNGSIWETVGSDRFSIGDVGHVSLHVDDGIPYVAYMDAGSSNKATVMKYCCTVNFDSQGGSTVKSIDVADDGRTISAITAPTKEGYNFDGWYKELGYLTEWDFSSDIVTENMTLYAKWTAKPTYTVTFDSQGGSAVNQIADVEEGRTIAAVTAPTKEGYNFDGWYKESGYVTEWDFSSDTVTSDMTLYAKWTVAINLDWKVVGHEGFSKGMAFYTSIHVVDGTPYVAYSDSENGNKAIVMKYDGLNWEPVGDEGFSAGEAIDISMYIYKGTPYVAYRDWENGGKATVMKYDGLSWEAVGGEAFSKSNAEFTSLYVYEGTPYVAFRDYGSSAEATVMKYNGSNWEAVGDEGFSKDNAEYTSLFIYEGTIYVAYVDDGNDSKATVMKYDGLSWEAVGGEGFSAGEVNYTSMYIYEGILYVAYRDVENDNKATVMKYDGSSWEAVGGAGFSAGKVYETSIYVYEGVPYVAYVNDSDKATVMKYKDSSWQVVGGPGLSKKRSGYVSLYVEDGIPYVSYTDEANNFKATAMKYCYTVNFDSQGGSTVKSIDVADDGRIIKAPTAPTKLGYTFDGWYKESGYVTEWDFSSDIVTSDMTLYAKWTTQSSSGGNSSHHNNSTSSLVKVEVNGEKEEGIGKTKTKTKNNQKIITVEVDEKKLEEELENKGQKARVAIIVKAQNETVVGQFSGQMIKNMEEKQDIIEIINQNVTYILPADQIKIDEVSKQLGEQIELKDISIDIEIGQTAKDMVKVVEDTAKKDEFTLVVPPVNFTVKSRYKDQTISVKNFNSYVERTVAIPKDVNTDKITTAIIVYPDGSTCHVPTQIIIIDGKYYAKINSLTNSTYSIIWNPREYSDIEDHWAKEICNDMGARMVAEEETEEIFNPDKKITRLFFTQTVVRALGLGEKGTECRFADVNEDKDYFGALATSEEYDLINGYTDNTFRANNNITREEAAALIARTLKIVGLKIDYTEVELQNELNKFVDKDNIGEWAKEYVAICAKNGLIEGNTKEEFLPKQNITKAEVAAIVKRVLEKAELI